MIYLISQIVISLLLAALAGGAIGWIAHRAKAAKNIKVLHNTITRQQQQVSQAHTEVSILTDDYDDLKHQTQTEIDRLQSENNKIPALNQNLEKSQLLVRQLYQKHEAELRETADERDKLAMRLRNNEHNEQAFNKIKAELEIEQRRAQKETPKPQASNAQSELQLEQTVAKTQSAVVTPETNQANAESANTNSADAPATPSTAISKKSTVADTHAELRALRDELAVDLPSQRDKKTNVAKKTSTKPSSLMAAAAVASGATAAASVTSKEDTEISSSEQIQPRTTDKAQVDKKPAQIEQMFTPVEQRDDLKQIFGIGPVTEETLNKLGITSYSQLAELKRHDIEKIADALQIFPGRIERDNWVGGARAQLEEVLEDL